MRTPTTRKRVNEREKGETNETKEKHLKYLLLRHCFFFSRFVYFFFFFLVMTLLNSFAYFKKRRRRNRSCNRQICIRNVRQTRRDYRLTSARPTSTPSSSHRNAIWMRFQFTRYAIALVSHNRRLCALRRVCTRALIRIMLRLTRVAFRTRSSLPFAGVHNIHRQLKRQLAIVFCEDRFGIAHWNDSFFVEEFLFLFSKTKNLFATKTFRIIRCFFSFDFFKKNL